MEKKPKCGYLTHFFMMENIKIFLAFWVTNPSDTAAFSNTRFRRLFCGPELAATKTVQTAHAGIDCRSHGTGCRLARRPPCVPIFSGESGEPGACRATSMAVAGSKKEIREAASCRPLTWMPTHRRSMFTYAAF